MDANLVEKLSGLDTVTLGLALEFFVKQALPKEELDRTAVKRLKELGLIKSNGSQYIIEPSMKVGMANGPRHEEFWDLQEAYLRRIEKVTRDHIREER